MYTAARYLTTRLHHDCTSGGAVASITKRGKRWRVQVRHGEQSVSRTFGTKAEAMAWAVQAEDDHQARREGRSTSDTLRAALTRYERDVVPSRRGERWERVRVAAWLRGEMPYLDWPLGRITAAELSKWRDDRLKQVSPGTVDRESTILRAVWTLARREWRWIASSPWPDVGRPPRTEPRTRRVTDAEAAAIVKRLRFVEGRPVTTQSQRVAVAFLVALETAMRAGEILSLTSTNVDRGRRVAHLALTKNGTARDVPLSKRAVELLGMVWTDGALFPMSAATRDTLFRRAVQDCGIVGLRFHDSRREALTRLAKRLQPMDLARVSGHKDLRTLLSVYYAPAVDDLVRALDG